MNKSKTEIMWFANLEALYQAISMHHLSIPLALAVILRSLIK
jgi:hypothetical protein